MDDLFHDGSVRLSQKAKVKRDIEFYKLQRHIERLHPTKIVKLKPKNGQPGGQKRERFGVCDKLG